MLAKKAVIVGASGLVGTELMQLLLNDERYDRVLVWVRRKLPMQHPKLEQEIIDFEKLDAVAHELAGADVFCTLGTTIKKAGSQPAFIKVDYEYPLHVAQLSKQQGAASFVIVTALGSNPKSSIFYSRVKGELEIELQKLELSRLHILQPSMLLGDRVEVRPGERIAAMIMKVLPFLFIGPLKRYKAIHAHTVAKGMIKAAQHERLGNYTYKSEQIVDLASTIAKLVVH